jgi:hypothetical protein
MNYEPGTVIQVRTVGNAIRHPMTCIGDGLVVNTEPKRGVHVDTLRSATGGREVSVVVPAPKSAAARSVVVHRALGMVGQAYNLLLKNCEHIAFFARFGRAFSPQVIWAVMSAAILFLCCLFAPRVIRRAGFWVVAIVVIVLGFIFIVPKLTPQEA